MFRALSTLVASGALLFSAAVAVAGELPPMQEGQWQITVKMEMPGMPMEMPPMTISQCITKKDLVPRAEQPGQECKVQKPKIDGGSVSWQVECKGDGGVVKGSGKVVYKDTTFEGVIDMTMTSPDSGGAPMTMKQKLSGKRTGDCKKDAAK